MNVNGKDNDGTNSQIKVADGGSGFKVTGWGYRHQQCLILFVCLTTAYSMRACMGVALVAMVDSDFNVPHALFTNNSLLENNINGSSNVSTERNDTSADEIESSGILNTLLLVPPYPKFNWNKKTQDNILSSFFFGYMLLQIPAGQLAHFFGARYLLTGALIINCVISLCLPWAAFYGGWILTSICRMVQGLSQACVIPSMHTMFGKWTTLEERGRLAGLAYGGQALGAVLGLPITGFIAASPLGWPGIFRFYGIISGLVGGVIWALAANTPAEHPKISVAEKQYIEENIGTNENKKKVVDFIKLRVPWGSILRCRGLYAIVIAHIGNTWGQLTLYSEVPAYMDKVMGVNIKANGVLTALPFLVMWFTNFFFSWFTDMLIVKKILSVRHTRKLANSIGCIPAAIGLIVLAYAPKNIYVVELILIIVCGFKIACHVGFIINHIDISSNFSGTMMSISNFMSNSFGVLAPMVAGYILTDVTDVVLWRKVFFIAAGLYFFTNLVYVILGTAEKEDWDNPQEESDDVEDAKEMERMLNEDKKDNIIM